MLRYDDMKIDRLLIKEYQAELASSLKRIKGINDVELLLAEFEKVFAQYIGTRYAIALNSGSDAIQLALLASGIGKGDRVIIPNVTYPAVALSVCYTGAEPILIDCKDDDLQINENLIERRITKNTKAIIAAHMFARPCAIEPICNIAKKHKLLVIEDVCQAESSEYKKKKLGSFGDISCFSFSYYKPLSSCAGGGGMVCFNNDTYKKIMDYTKVWMDTDALLTAGKRFARMYFLDLVAVRTKFKFLKDIIKTRLIIKETYENELANVPSITIFRDTENALSVPQNFVILSKKRARLGAYLSGRDVNWQKPYTPLHMMDNFKQFAKNEYPASERYAKEALQLPLFSFMKKEEAMYICRLVHDFIHSSR